MNAVDIIRKKRDGIPNSSEELQFLICGALRGDVPRYQVSAWLMAACFQGLSEKETIALTRILASSGKAVDFGHLPSPAVDKHSTGGVGDKTSLVVAPMVAAAGLYVPMISGRALGHTGGTLDKLESIPGFRTDLFLKEFEQTVENCGLAMIGQTDELAPADRMLYAIRDVTATVECIPLIVASIVSKKVAEGTRALVLDVKTGEGAFMKTLSDAERLARALTRTCRSMNLKATAVISDMSQPLGRMVGNALEVQEAIEILQNRGPEDLVRLCTELSAHMLMMGGKQKTLESARRLARHQLESGAALRQFGELVRSQGGNAEVIRRGELLPKSRGLFDYKARKKGYVHQARADLLGRAAMLLGAGRQTVDSKIDYGVGLELMKKVGDPVEAGETLLRVHHEDESALDETVELVAQAYAIRKAKPRVPLLIYKVIR